MADDIMKDLGKQFEVANLKLDAMNERLNKKGKELEKLKAISMKRYAKMGEINKQIESMKAVINKVTDSDINLVKIQRENKTLITEIHKYKKKALELHESVKKIKQSPNNIQSLTESDLKEIEEWNKATAEEEKSIDEGDQVVFFQDEDKKNEEDKIDKLRGKIKELEIELGRSTEENRAMDEKHKNLKGEIDKLSKEIKEKAEDNKKIMEEIEEAQNRCTATIKRNQETDQLDNVETENRIAILEANESEEVDNKATFYQEKIEELKGKLKAADEEYYEM